MALRCFLCCFLTHLPRLLRFLPLGHFFVFAVTGVNFPVALLIYWTVSNFWTMGQQFFIIRNMPAPNTPAEKKYLERMARKGKSATGVQLKNPNYMAERQAAETEAAEQARTTGQRVQPKSKKRARKR